MYSGELEVQAKRKTIAILQEETNKILNLSQRNNNHDVMLLSNDNKNELENLWIR